MIAENERKHYWKRFAGPGTILIAAAVAVTPQLIRGNSCGHDFDFHLVSWLDCVNAWRHGILYPHWAPSPNYGAGEPRFVYYPPLAWMAGAALGLVLPWNLVPIALTFLLLAGTGLATRALALEALDEKPATLAGCVSLFSAYALFTVYERSAFPESSGGFWLPLLLLFVLRDRNSNARLVCRAFDGSTVPLALVFAGAWLSDFPLGVMAGYLLAGVALIWAAANRTWAPLLRAALAAVLGLGLSAFYWLPAAWERFWVDIRQATQDPGSSFQDNWLFVHHANPTMALHDEVLRQVSWIAVAMIAAAVAGVIVAWRRGTLPKQRHSTRRLWIPLAAIPIVVLVLMVPISRPLWLFLPEMRFLQYPWRWLEAVEAPVAIFVMAAIWPRSRVGRTIALTACCVGFLGLTVLAGTDYFQVCYPEDTVAATLADYRAGTGFEGMYEYEPPGGDDGSIATGLPDACLVSDPSAVLGRPDPDDPGANPIWSADQGSCLAVFAFAQSSGPENRWILVYVPRPGYLVLRLTRFPAWSLSLNGQPVCNVGDREDGLIAVPVLAGKVDLTASWTTTPDVAAARWLGAVSVLLLTSLWWLELRHRNPRLR